MDPWLSSLWSALNQTFPTIISSDSDSGLSQIGTLDQVKFQIIYHGSDNVQQSSSIMKGTWI